MQSKIKISVHGESWGGFHAAESQTSGRIADLGRTKPIFSASCSNSLARSVEHRICPFFICDRYDNEILVAVASLLISPILNASKCFIKSVIIYEYIHTINFVNKSYDIFNCSVYKIV